MPAAQTTYSLPLTIGGRDEDQTQDVVALITKDASYYKPTFTVFIRQDLDFKPSDPLCDLQETMIRERGEKADIAFEKVTISVNDMWHIYENGTWRTSPRKPVITPTTLIKTVNA